MTALLPCPWCKTTALHLDSFRVTYDEADEPIGSTAWRVMHNEGQTPFCEAWGPEMATREEAAAAWNRRPPSPAMLGLVEALENIADARNGSASIARAAIAAYKKEIGE